MKWGVRKGRSAQVKAKATKKLLKLDKKADKMSKKALRSRYSFLTSLLGQGRYIKKQAKADKAMNKAADWYDSMEMVLGKEMISDISNSRNVNLAQKYSGFLANSTSDAMRTMNEYYTRLHMEN